MLFETNLVSFKILNLIKMKSVKYIIVLLLFPLFAFTSAHKYYVSVTQVNYIKEKKALQITTRIFIDDLEKLLQERYNKSITLSPNKDEKKIDTYIETYIKSKFNISINNKAIDYTFLGKDYDEDIIQCYIEIENIDQISSLSITNKILFDMFDEQKNVVRTHINKKHKSFILIPENDKGVLNF